MNGRLTSEMPDHYAYAIALLGGTTLWLLTSLISGRDEAWDAPMGANSGTPTLLEPGPPPR